MEFYAQNLVAKRVRRKKERKINTACSLEKANGTQCPEKYEDIMIR